uniref:Gap junction protein n=1 Tax=Calidris pygmaea TaxID=425635 RepID=A0A8C3JU09_9CHAR
MGDWNFLGGILEEVHIHSTIIGKIWLTILFIFRMLVLGVATEDVWNDEQSEFICNTEQPGCRNVCYDEAFPISLIRYWVLQVIFVSSPSLVYMGHALYRLRALEKERQKKKAQVRVELESTELEMTENRKRLERELRQLDQRKLNKAPLRGSLLCTYVIHIFTRSAVEVGFMIGQYLLYGFHLDPLYKCQRDPCPNIVDCFVSRPTEKTVFILFMQSIATVSLLLNILEIIHLGFRKIKMGLCGQNKTKDDPDNFYVNKSKKYSVIPHSSLGISTTPQKNVPSALSGYTFLTEKETDTAVYPVLNSPPVFQSVQNNRTESSSNYTHHSRENKSPKKRFYQSVGTTVFHKNKPQRTFLPGAEVSPPRCLSAGGSAAPPSAGFSAQLRSLLRPRPRPCAHRTALPAVEQRRAGTAASQRRPGTGGWGVGGAGPFARRRGNG